ncbi:MAG: hypothetical protein PHX34_05770, partial [Candidatus Shapirobacteria bacterium]|nr:hypothetical protein [Candidatus Shapirobacteria bacterium]
VLSVNSSKFIFNFPQNFIFNQSKLTHRIGRIYKKKSKLYLKFALLFFKFTQRIGISFFDKFF